MVISEIWHLWLAWTYPKIKFRVFIFIPLSRNWIPWSPLIFPSTKYLLYVSRVQTPPRKTLSFLSLADNAYSRCQWTLEEVSEPIQKHGPGNPRCFYSNGWGGHHEKLQQCPSMGQIFSLVLTHHIMGSSFGFSTWRSDQHTFAGASQELDDTAGPFHGISLLPELKKSFGSSRSWRS